MVHFQLIATITADLFVDFFTDYRLPTGGVCISFQFTGCQWHVCHLIGLVCIHQIPIADCVRETARDSDKASVYTWLSV